MGRPRGGRMKNVAEKFKRTSQKKAATSRRLLMKDSSPIRANSKLQLAIAEEIPTATQTYELMKQ